MRAHSAAHPRRVILSVLCLSLAACSPHKVTHNPEPPVEVPEGYAGGGGGSGPERWWQSFGDPELTALVDQTIAGNLELKAAWARLEQAEAVARRAGAARWPTVDAQLEASRRQILNPFAGSADAPPGLPTTFKQNNFNLSARAAYEVDVFRRVGSQVDAASLDAEAARDDVSAVAMSLAANTAETYFDLVLQRARRDVLVAQIETSKLFLELVRLRFEQGLGSSLDVYQQEQQLSAIEAQVPLVESSIEVLSRQLAVLSGQPPRALDTGDRAELPELPELPGTGVPADLLQRRPDVRAMQRRVEAADYGVAAAVADRLPSLRLTGSYGYSNPEIKDLFTAPIWSIAGSLLAPLFDGGSRKAEVDRREAVVRELSMRYGQTLLVAMVEVENSLVLEKHQQEHLELLEQQLETANKALVEAQARYREGISEQGFLQVLTALSTQQQAELGVLQARRQLLSYRIQLCRALGGTWTSELSDGREEEQ